MRLARRRGALLALAGLGLAFRLWTLPRWGTFDIEVQKAWAARAATEGVADIYGPSDREILETARRTGRSVLGTLATLPQTTVAWGTDAFPVDYPPGSVLLAFCAGRFYRALSPELANRRTFNAAVNLAPLLGSLAIAALLLRSASGERSLSPPSGGGTDLGARRALLFWLNPAVMLAAPVLGYQDPVFAAFGLAAVMALADGRHASATALVVAAGLVKPQGVLLLPTLATVVLREARPRVWLEAAAAGAGVAALVLLPWWSGGHLLSALAGGLRPLADPHIAPQGLNLWWIAGYAMDWSRHGRWPIAGLVGTNEFEAWAGWDPRPVGLLLLGGATLANVALLASTPRAERRIVPLSVVFQVHAYALLATGVHENHTFLAVALAPLLLGVWSRGAALLAGTSGVLFFSLFLAVGLGRRVTTLRWVRELRGLTLVDLSVIVAVLHVALLAWLALGLARTRREARSARPTAP